MVWWIGYGLECIGMAMEVTSFFSELDGDGIPLSGLP
jgi:hypothetical protein